MIHRFGIMACRGFERAVLGVVASLLIISCKAPAKRDAKPASVFAARSLPAAQTSGKFALRGTVREMQGKPIDRATVRITALYGRDSYPVHTAPAPVVESVQTTSAGGFAVDLSPGRYLVEASVAGFATGVHAIDLSAGSIPELRFDLVPAATLSGRVIDSGTKEGLAGIVVRADPAASLTLLPQTRRAAAATTDDTGRFSISGLADGTFRLSATGAAHSSREPITLSIAPAETVSDVSIEVASAFGLRGVVLDARKEPVGGARVYAAGVTAPTHFGVSELTEADGNFEVTALPPGDYELRVAAEGAWPRRVQGTFRIVDADVGGQTLTLAPGVTVSGRVQGGTGVVTLASLANNPTAPVVVHDVVQVSTAGPQADFRFAHVPPGRYVVSASSSDGRVSHKVLDVGQHALEGTQLSFSNGTIAGRVADEEGQGIQGAWVLLAAETADNSYSATRPRYLQTGTDGLFQIRGLPTATYRLSAYRRHDTAIGHRMSQDTKPTAETEVTLAEGATISDVSLLLPFCDSFISGVVLDASRKPVPGAYVSVSPEPGAARVAAPVEDRIADFAVTFPNGRFRFEGLCAGTHTIRATDTASHRALASNVSKGADIELMLKPASDVHGAITHSGKPVQDVRLILSGPVTWGARYQNSDASYTIPRLDPGSYEMLVTSEQGYAYRNLAVGAADSITSDLELSEWTTVSGTVVDATGQPKKNIRVWVAVVAAGWRLALESLPNRRLRFAEAETDESGRFELTGIVSGDALLTFWDGPRRLMSAPTIVETIKGPLLGRNSWSQQKLVPGANDLGMVRVYEPAREGQM